MAETAPTADELLAHTDWLMQLARALVGDASAADVVQETYEVALTRPPRRDGALRPWLGGVARNLARMATRGRVRRERREDAVGVVAAEVPTPEQLVERLQMQQQVARIVLELPEPLRATLLLRFFEGLTAAEIARAQGIPAATVRGRLKDALDRVRSSLDTQHDRRRWVLLIAPLPVAGARTAATASLAGGILVKTGMKVAIAIVVALVVVLGSRWAGWWGRDAAEPTKPVERAGTLPVIVNPPVAATSAAPRVMLSVHDDDPRGALRLEGQVIDEHDAPVGGAHVAIDAHPPIVVDTEADGSFTFEGLIPRDYRLEATAGDGYAGPARLRLTAKAEPITLRMRRGGTVDVAVMEAAGGKPIAGAEVELRSTLTWRAKSDAKGIAQLRGVGSVWAPLAVRAIGFAPAGMMLSTSGDPAAPERVSLALARGAAIAGRVVDEAGKPVDGARVVATSASEPFPVIDPRRDGVLTSADGAFTIPTIAAGTWRLTATHGDHGPATSPPLTIDGSHPRTGVELVLVAGGVVRGVVRDGAGQPVGSADVRVVVRGHLDWRTRRQALTSSDGTFAITGLPRRAMDVVAAHDGGASAIAAADLAAKREHDVVLVLDITGAIEGTVVDRAGAPIGDAQVIAEPVWSGGVADREAWSVRGVQETVTDQGGKFRFAGLPDASYRVRAARPGAPESALSLAAPVVARPGGSALRIVVPAEGRIVGKVALADGKVPPRFSIALASTYPMPFSSADGKFALPATAGSHVLVVSGPGFVEKTVRDVASVEGKDTDLGTITVAPGRSVSGRVLDANGVPVAKAKVVAGALLTGGGSELYIKDESLGAKDTETDDDGRFTLDGFGPPAVTIVAGKESARSPSIRIPPGPDSATLELVLQPTTGVDGKVTRDGKPAGDVVVIANPIGATASNFFVITGPDGTFALDALAPGTYVIHSMMGGGGNRPKDMYVRRVEVALGARARVDIDASPGPITLGVTVKTNAGAVGMAQVIAIQAAIDPATMEDLRDGSRLPLGDHVVPMYLRGAMSGTAEIAGMRPGIHTVCALPMGGDVDDPSKAPMKCSQIKLDAATPKRTLDVVVQLPKQP